MTTELIDRYVAVWNEPDAGVRRKLTAQLWTVDGRQILQPPQEVRDRAAASGLTSAFVARGHEQLEERIRLAYQKFVAPGQYVFRSRGDVDRLDDVVKFHWEMVTAGSGEVAAVGLDFLVLEGDLIRVDYQFIER